MNNSFADNIALTEPSPFTIFAHRAKTVLIIIIVITIQRCASDQQCVNVFLHMPANCSTLPMLSCLLYIFHFNRSIELIMCLTTMTRGQTPFACCKRKQCVRLSVTPNSYIKQAWHHGVIVAKEVEFHITQETICNKRKQQEVQDLHIVYKMLQENYLIYSLIKNFHYNKKHF